MPLKRALVVDDSKVARVTLKKQLEQYNLSVELAESGEEALELLKSHVVDVIFMDHIMPGMDGLQAVSLIKSNPKTATIPVMMYTSKEGEVYVSEARALGAVGVLPKQVQHDVLFGMLLKLGLVRDRRGESRVTAPASSDTDTPEVDKPARPAGFEISALMSRMLEDQQSELRTEIRSSYQQIAKQIASEVHQQLREHHELEKLEGELNRQSISPWPMLSTVLAVAAMMLLVLTLQMRAELNAVQNVLTRASAENQRNRQVLTTLSDALQMSPEDAQALSALDYPRLLGTIAWVLNEAGAVPFEERPFNDARADLITGTLWQLSEAGFKGTLRIDSHLGEFCLVSNAAGTYELQDPELPLSSCSFIGHPLDDSQLPGDRQTAGFEVFLETSPLLTDTDIELELVTHDRAESYPRVPYPADAMTAGEWNRIAAQNNRLEYSLIVAGPD
ncbi:MAG: response regulator [Woeseia sp.]